MWRKFETLIFHGKGERWLRSHMRISRTGNKSLAEVEICSFPAQLLCQDLWQLPPACAQVQRRQGVRLPRVGFCQVIEKTRVLGILVAGKQAGVVATDPGWGEGCARKVEKRR